MKARVIIFEADDVSPADVGEVLSRVFAGSFEPPGPPPAALPETPAPAAALPAPAAPPAATAAKVSDSPRRRVARMKPGWRPPAPESRGSQPATPAMVMCGACGGELPEGKDKRSRCPKCNARAWEEVPARDRSVDAEAA